MKLSKGDLVLYSLHMIKEDTRTDRIYSKAHLSNAIGISENTLDLYLTNLKSQGYIERIKRKYVHDLRQTVEITESGRGYLDQISKVVDCLLLTEQRHNIPACIEVTKIMAQLPDALEKAFFLSIYTQSKYIDIPVVLNSLRISRDETNLLNVLSSMEPNPLGTTKESYLEAIFKTSCYGDFDPEIIKREEWPKEDLNVLIILGQAKTRMGKLEDAGMIFEYLLKRTDLTLNQWFALRINLMFWYTQKGDLKEAVKLGEDLINSVDNKVMQAYAKTMKAFAVFHLGDRKAAMELYKSAISSFTTYGLPLFLSISHNLRGVSYFVMREYKEAENDWIKARKYAKEAKSEFAEAKVLPNLADIAMMNGKYDLTKAYLDKASDIFRKYSDYEGVAVVEFNLTLLSLEVGDMGGVRDHFKRCKEVAFPLPPRFMLDVYKEDIIKRAKAKGIEDIDDIFS